MTRQDLLRNMTMVESEIMQAMELHRGALAQLASQRRSVIRDMVKVARADGSRHPQQDVAVALGITQQAVSKIIAGSRD